MAIYLRKTSSILLLTLILPVFETLPYWKDVKVTGVNKEFPRTTFMFEKFKLMQRFQYYCH